MAAWETKLHDLLRNRPHLYVDAGQRDDYFCNTFVDGSHMSLDCYHPLLLILMHERPIPSL